MEIDTFGIGLGAENRYDDNNWIIQLLYDASIVHGNTVLLGGNHKD